MLTQACQRCFVRKQKCDRQNPCSACSSAGAKCVPRIWGHIIDSTNDEASEYRRAGSVIEYMKQRIEFLESQVHDGDNGNTNSTRNPNPVVNNEARPQEQSPSANEVEYLSLTAMSGGDKHSHGPYQGSTLSKVIESLVSLHGDSSLSSSLEDKSHGVLETTLLEAFDEIKKLTGKDEGYFVETFCEVASWSFTFASKTMYLDTVQAVRRADRGTAQNHASQLLATNAVFASASLSIGILMSPFHTALRHPLSKLISISQRMLPNASTQDSDVTAIRCLSLQTILSLYSPQAGSAWHLLGLALTKAISAGLHRISQPDNSDGSNGDTIPLFWTLYVLDRAMAITMGRPFGLEDEDLTLSVPDIPLLHPLDDKIAASDALFLWRLQHSRLLSSLRRKSDINLDTSFASYHYWRDTYRELFVRLKRTRSNVASNDDHYRIINALIQKDELQLSCRILIQLIDLGIRDEVTTQESFQKVQQHAISEIPCLLNTVQTCIDSHDIAISFLDGYDVFASAIVYAFCLYEPQGSQAFHLNMTQTRTITASINILQRVSQQFKAMRGLKDIIWSFLAALEAKGDQSSLQNLEGEYARCETPIPSHVKRIIKYCL